MDELSIDEQIAKAQEAEAKERAARDAAEKAKLFAEHPEYFTDPAYVNCVSKRMPPALPGRVVCKVPDSTRYKKFRDTSAKGSAAEARQARDELVVMTRVYPPRDEAGNATFRAMVDAFPGIIDAVFVALIEVTNGAEREAGKG